MGWRYGYWRSVPDRRAFTRPFLVNEIEKDLYCQGSQIFFTEPQQFKLLLFVFAFAVVRYSIHRIRIVAEPGSSWDWIRDHNQPLQSLQIDGYTASGNESRESAIV